MDGKNNNQLVRIEETPDGEILYSDVSVSKDHDIEIRKKAHD
jgi:hypothetical protein